MVADPLPGIAAGRRLGALSSIPLLMIGLGVIPPISAIKTFEHNY